MNKIPKVGEIWRDKGKFYCLAKIIATDGLTVRWKLINDQDHNFTSKWDLQDFIKKCQPADLFDIINSGKDGSNCDPKFKENSDE